MFETRNQHESPSKRMRYRFQLTSLMDLLLIIVFAQFLEYRQASVVARQESESTLAANQAKLSEQFERQQARLSSREKALERENTELVQQREIASERAAAADRERELAIEAVVKLLNVEPSSFSAADSPEGAGERVENAQQIGRRLEEVNATEVLRFLVGYDELLKRAEVWSLHVSDRGDISIDNGQTEEAFRLEAPTQARRTDEFVQQLRAAAQAFPQPKGLVVVLASYSPQAIAGNYQPMIDGLPRAIELLSADDESRSRFEFAVIGAISDPERDLTRPLPP